MTLLHHNLFQQFKALTNGMIQLDELFIFNTELGMQRLEDGRYIIFQYCQIDTSSELFVYNTICSAVIFVTGISIATPVYLMFYYYMVTLLL